MKSLLRIGLAALALLAILVVSLPFSEQGTRWLAENLQRVAPLEIEHRAGSLASRLELSRLAYRSDKLQVELLEVATQMDLDCLWRSAICLAELNVGDLVIDLGSGAEEDPGLPSADPDSDDPKTRFLFPVAIESGMLRVARTHIRWPGGEWSQGQALLRSVSLRESTIAIAGADLASTRLVVEAAEDDEPPDHERIELPALRLPLTLSLGALSLHQPRWEVMGSILEHDSLTLSGKWRQTTLSLRSLEAISGEHWQLSGEGAVEFTGDWPLSWSGALTLNEQHAVAGFPGGPLAIDVSGRLSAFSASAFGPGDREIRLGFESDLLDRLLPFTATLEIDGDEPLLLSELPGVPHQLAEMTVAFPWRVDARGSLESQRFSVHGAFSGAVYSRLELTAQGERLGETIRLDRLSLLDEQSDSRLDAAGQVTLRDETLLSLSLATAGLMLPELSPLEVGRLRGGLSVEARVGADRWQLGLTDIDLRADVNGRAASAFGTFFFDQDWSLGDSELQVLANGAELSLFGVADGSREGRLEIAVEQIGRWLPGSRGSVDLQGRIDPRTREVDLSGEIGNFSSGNLVIEKATLDGRYAVEGSVFDLSLLAPSLVAADAVLSGVSLTVSGNERQQSARLASEGDLQGQVVLSGTGWGAQWRGSMATTSIGTPLGNWELDRSVAMGWEHESGQLAVASHCWRRDTASVCLGDLRLGRAGEVQADVSGDLANFRGLLPADMEIRGDAQFSLAGSWNARGEMLFEGRSQTRSVSVTRHYGEDESATVHWERGEGRVSFDGSVASLQWALYREGQRIFDLDLQAPVSGSEPLAGGLTVARLQLEPLIAFIPALSRLGGEVSGQLAIAGTRDQPLATGELRLSDGLAAVAGNPTRLEAMDVRVALQGGRARVSGSGLLGGGKVVMEGELDLQPDWELRLKVSGERQNVLYPPATELLLSERLTITATRQLVSVSGDVTVHEGRLEPEQLPEGSVAVSPHVVEVDYQGNVLRRQLPFDISIDVRVVVEDRFEIQSSIMFATLGGELQILQRPGQPLQLFGTMRVVDGHVTAYKQKLQIQRGVFNFSGRPENPSVNARAVRNISGSNVVVGIEIQGTYEALSMNVFSEPAMSEGEAMSYLVRGRGLDASAGEDGTALALSVASGVVNRSTLVSELNRIPGVSNVSFGAEGSNDDTAATVSGFIGDRIYLSYGIGVYEPINVLTARFFLRTRLWLEVVSRLENSVDLYYAFDID